ncbi:MAG: hypothetical protein R3B96_14665 [Pirellulaceae bacterium]
MLATLALNSIVAASVILLLLFLSRWTSLSQLQELAGWAPTVLILILFYGGQFLLRDKQQSVAFLAYDLPEWTRFFPVAWLAASIAEPPNFMSWVSRGSLLGWLLAASAVWFATFAGLSRFIASWHRYAAGGSSNVQRQLAVPGQLLGKVATRIIGSPLTQVGYWLSGTMLARDANIKMRCWTSFSFAFAPLVIGLLSGRLGNPLAQPLADSATSIVAIHLVAFSIPGVIAALRYSRDHECVWVLAVSPIANPSPLYDGIGLRFLTHFYLPALALMSVVWSVLWQAPFQALLHSLVGLTSSAAAYYLCLSLGTLQLPFSQPATTHGWTSESFRLGIIVGVWTSLAAGLHVAAIQLGLPMIFLPLGLLVVAIIGRMVVQRKGERHAA